MALGLQVGVQPQGVAAALSRPNGDSVHSSTPASVQSASSSSSMFRGHLRVAAASKARLVVSQHNRNSVQVTCEAATAVSGDTSAPGNLFLFLVKGIVESPFLVTFLFYELFISNFYVHGKQHLKRIDFRFLVQGVRV